MGHVSYHQIFGSTKPTLLAGQFGDYLQSFQTIKKEKDRMSFCCLGRLFQPHSMLKRLKQNNLKEFCSFHTTVFPLHSEWMKQQGQAVKMQGNAGRDDCQEGEEEAGRKKVGGRAR